MDYKSCYRSCVSCLISRIISVSFLSGRPFTSCAALARELGISVSQMSRVSSGVCSLSAENFYHLFKISCNVLGESSTIDILCASLLIQ